MSHSTIRRPDVEDVTIGVSSAGLAVALLFGGMHLLWVLCVASGFAQSLMDFVFWLHFIRSSWAIDSFAFGRAAGLIAMTSAVGYATGAVFALIWNRLHRSSR